MNEHIDSGDYTYDAPVTLVRPAELDAARADLAAALRWMRRTLDGLTVCEMAQMADAVDELAERWQVQP